MSNRQAESRGEELRASESPIFIVGVPRSGTTLASALLSAHPHIAIAPETHFLTQWLRHYAPRRLRRARLEDVRPDDVRMFWERVQRTRRFSYLDVDPLEVWRRASKDGRPNPRSLFAGLLQVYAARREKPRWGEKTPAHDAEVPRLLEWFPAARILYLLRDPRAVVHSLAQTPWGSRQTPDAHALRWGRSVDRMQRWGPDPRVRVVRYEQLVTRTTDELKGICDFIGEAFEEGMITDRSPATTPAQGRAGWARAHLEAALQPVSADAVERWRGEMPPESVAMVEQYGGPGMDLHGYARVTQGLGLARRSALMARRTLRRTARRLQPYREGQGGADDPGNAPAPGGPPHADARAILDDSSEQEESADNPSRP